MTLVVAPADLAEAYPVRHAVFVLEQGVPVELERDAADATAHHVVARLDGALNGAVVGAGRLVCDGPVGILGRLAVLPSARGQGIGAALVDLLERLAWSAGCDAVELHAQTHALGFYLRLGYVVTGPEFLEAGIPHRGMRKVRPGAVSSSGLRCAGGQTTG